MPTGGECPDSHFIPTKQFFSCPCSLRHRGEMNPPRTAGPCRAHPHVAAISRFLRRKSEAILHRSCQHRAVHIVSNPHVLRRKTSGQLVRYRQIDRYAARQGKALVSLD